MSPPNAASRDAEVGPLPAVAIWRTKWLPPSETFIAHQLGALRRWRPVPVGLHRVRPSLPVPPVRAPFPDSTTGRRLVGAAAKLGYPLFYGPFLRAEGVRLVHAHFGPDAVASLPIIRRTGLPLVVTFHGYDVTSATAQVGPLGDRYRAELAEVFAVARTLIAVSSFIAEQLAALGAPRDKIRIIPIGTPTTASVPAVGDAADRRGVIFVGRLVPKKGVDDLLAALRLLPPELAREGVRIVGYGPLAQSLQRQAADVGVPVEFLGRRTSAEIAGLLRSSRIFCAPSKTAEDGDAEGFGMVHLEAALEGVPSVAFRHGGVPEAVVDGTTGLLADEGDVAGLADRLRTLLEQPELAERMGRAGRERVLSDFAIDRCTAVLEALYDEVARPS